MKNKNSNKYQKDETENSCIRFRKTAGCEEDPGRFGIDIRSCCRQHEEFLRSQEPGKELLDCHLRRLGWLSHERLVHLIVTVMTVLIELFILDLVLLHPELGVLPAVFLLGFAILLLMYFLHYFFLENTVQRWYRIADDLESSIRAGGSEGGETGIRTDFAPESRLSGEDVKCSRMM